MTDILTDDYSYAYFYLQSTHRICDTILIGLVTSLPIQDCNMYINCEVTIVEP
jgi:hypothetical protein